MKKILLIVTQAIKTQENNLFFQAFQEVDFPCAMISLDWFNFQFREKEREFFVCIPIDKFINKNTMFDILLHNLNSPLFKINQTFLEKNPVIILVRRLGKEHTDNSTESLIQFLNRLNKLYYLEQLGIKVINAPQSIEKSMDKIITYSIINKLNLKYSKIIETVCISSLDYLKEFYEKNSKNIVVKQNFGSKGDSILFLNSVNFNHQITALESLINQGNSLIGQRCIESAIGDLRVLVFNKRVIGVLDRSAIQGQKLFNISQGGVSAQWKVELELRNAIFKDAIHIAEHIGCILCGVDFLHDSKDYYFLETNAIPGLSSMGNYYIGSEKSIFLDIVKNI